MVLEYLDPEINHNVGKVLTSQLKLIGLGTPNKGEDEDIICKLYCTVQCSVLSILLKIHAEKGNQ
jgi:hypothetical protein